MGDTGHKGQDTGGKGTGDRAKERDTSVYNIGVRRQEARGQVAKGRVQEIGHREQDTGHRKNRAQ